MKTVKDLTVVTRLGKSELAKLQTLNVKFDIVVGNPPISA